MSYLTREQLEQLGLKEVGANVKISAKASLYNCGRISIGSNVRIDDFCVLSAGEGGIDIGSYVHVAVNCLLVGAAKVTLGDFSGISSRVAIYSSSDDYSGNSLTNPTVPDEYTDRSHGDVTLGRHAIVGAGSVILPGVSIGDGAAVGALSLVTKNCEEFYIYAGNPAKKLKRRATKLLQLEHQFLNASN
ncbi:acyltransferase [Teredinibacter turnerae]|uniref:acyltransferase n=1 Tax=Teredinibacter turnerae TaxID=2426 RepID=UPI0003707EDB|nr:acyltransferase [Teredinibacter turnerae]